MKKAVVLTGAGVSAESGLQTFRDSDGLWEKYRIEDVATPEAWRKDFKTVLEFYNQRRKQVLSAHPNPAHYALARLQEVYDVQVVTQNIDDLHERAGSLKVLHLHGEILKSRSTRDERLIYPVSGWELKPGDVCEKGSQLRPHIVWFGELVPLLPTAAELVAEADLLLVVGTSLAVYPAASLIDYAPSFAERYLVDPNAPSVSRKFKIYREKAGTGVPALVDELLSRSRSSLH